MSMAPTMMPQPGQSMPQDDMSQNMQSFAEQTGRGGDSVLGHLTPGEIVIPIDAQTETLLMAIRDAFEEMGVNPREFVVGDSENKINSQTGNPEYFFSGLRKKLKKARDKIKKSRLARTILPMALTLAFPYAGPMAATMMANPLGAAAVNYTSNRLVGNDHDSSLTGAVISGGLTGAGNMASGSTFMGGGSAEVASDLANNIAGSPGIDPMVTNAVGGTAAGGMTINQATSNMFGPGNAIGNATSGVGATMAAPVVSATAQGAGAATASGVNDATAEQEELKAKALAEFNKPLELLSEEELAQLLNDPLKRTINRGIYNYE